MTVLTVGSIVARRGSHIGGLVEQLLPGKSLRARVAWGAHRANARVHHSVLLAKSLEVVDTATLDGRWKEEQAKQRSSTAHYQYCALHHQRLNGDGTCCRCSATPASIYTLGDPTPRPYDGPEARPATTH